MCTPQIFWACCSHSDFNTYNHLALCCSPKMLPNSANWNADLITKQFQMCAKWLQAKCLRIATSCQSWSWSSVTQTHAEPSSLAACIVAEWMKAAIKNANCSDTRPSSILCWHPSPGVLPPKPMLNRVLFCMQWGRVNESQNGKLKDIHHMMPDSAQFCIAIPVLELCHLNPC